MTDFNFSAFRDALLSAFGAACLSALIVAAAALPAQTAAAALLHA